MRQHHRTERALRATAAVFSATILAPALAGAGTAPAPKPAPADTVYLNGYVYTADAHDSVAEAVLVRAGRIAFVGSSSEARKAAGQDARVIDLQQRMAMPGLVDGHHCMTRLSAAR